MTYWSISSVSHATSYCQSMDQRRAIAPQTFVFSMLLATLDVVGHGKAGVLTCCD